MLKPGADAPAGVVIDPIISVGDELDSGFMFDSIPDGISLVEHGKGRVDLYVNHETSKVPFGGFAGAVNAGLQTVGLLAPGLWRGWRQVWRPDRPQLRT